jgi:hypothetical protein
VTVRLRVPLLSAMIASLLADPVIVELVIDTVPVRPFGEPVPFGARLRPSKASPEPVNPVPGRRRLPPDGLDGAGRRPRPSHRRPRRHWEPS